MAEPRKPDLSKERQLIQLVPIEREERERSAHADPPTGRGGPALVDVVGRKRELHLLRAAIEAGCDVLLEGPPGTSKSTMLRAVAATWSVPLAFVEGNSDLTVSRLVGYHSPVRVLQEGYTTDNFVAGPLVDAMQAGGFLYIEEFNRAPADTISALLGAIAERQVTIPRVGTVTAQPSFRLIASMNPYDNVGTTRLPAALHDRVYRLSVDYQDAPSERAIVRQAAGSGLPPGLGEQLVADAVALTRATRDHADIAQGSSVRGAIDITRIGAQLMLAADVAHSDHVNYSHLILDAMLVALSGRIRLEPVSEHSPEQVLERIWEQHFLRYRQMAEPG